MIIYSKLWLLLKEKGLKRTDLLEVISSATLAKLGKNETVKTDVLERICDYLKCQPADIMENVTKEKVIEVGTDLNEKMFELLEKIETITGQTKEELFQEFIKDVPVLLEKIKSGDKDLLGISDLTNKDE